MLYGNYCARYLSGKTTLNRVDNSKKIFANNWRCLILRLCSEQCMMKQHTTESYKWCFSKSIYVDEWYWKDFYFFHCRCFCTFLYFTFVFFLYAGDILSAYIQLPHMICILLWYSAKMAWRNSKIQNRNVCDNVDVDLRYFSAPHLCMNSITTIHKFWRCIIVTYLIPCAQLIH